jgi:hypothetical protein
MSIGPHASWFRHRLGGAGTIEVGAEEHATRSWRSLGVRRTRRLAVAGVATLSLSCAASGIALAVVSGDVAVSMTAATYRVGSATLHAVQPGVYTGDGVMVISRHSGRGLRAGSSAIVNGRRWSGVCDVSVDGITETCWLATGDETVTARDTWIDAGWLRTYSDGQRVRIVSARGVPVPFPVGR